MTLKSLLCHPPIIIIHYFTRSCCEKVHCFFCVSVQRQHSGLPRHPALSILPRLLQQWTLLDVPLRQCALAGKTNLVRYACVPVCACVHVCVACMHMGVCLTVSYMHGLACMRMGVCMTDACTYIVCVIMHIMGASCLHVYGCMHVRT